MKHFGDWGNAPVTFYSERVPTPVGELCLFCDKPIEEGDAGMIAPFFDEGEEWKERAHHRKCFLESIFLQPVSFPNRPAFL